MKRSLREESDLPAQSNGVSSSAQPATKIVKIEEEDLQPVPSQEELQQKVAKLEKDFEVACRVAGEAQVRLRFLKDQLVEQRRLSTEQAAACEGQKNLVDELQKKLTEASTVIEDARKEAFDAKTSEEELKERVASLTHQLATERSRAIEDRMRGHASMDWMGRRVEEVNGELEQRVASLTQQLVAEKAKAIEDRMGDRQRIDELMHTLAHHQWQLLQQPGKDSETQTDAPESISIDQAPPPQQQSQQQQPTDAEEPRPPSIPRRFPPKNLFENHESEKNLPDYRKVAELQMRVASLTRQLEVERAKASEDSTKARERMEDMQLRHDEAQQRVLLSDDERKRDRNRIDELTRHLEEYERSKQQPQQAAASQPTNDGDAPTLPAPAATGSGHPKNIFWPCQSESSGSIHFQAAVRKLREHYFINDDRWRSSFAEAVAKERHPCNLCSKPLLKGLDVLAHFLSFGHSWMMTPTGSRVSLEAFQHWLRILKSIKKPDA